jgi:hypothetical protein
MKTKTDLNLELNVLVWRQLCNRLILLVDISGISHDLSRDSLKCPFKSSSPLFGIISYLTTKHGRNVSDKNIVAVTASGTYNENSGDMAKNATDFTVDSYWFSKNEDNS